MPPHASCLISFSRFRKKAPVLKFILMPFGSCSQPKTRLSFPEAGRLLTHLHCRSYLYNAVRKKSSNGPYQNPSKTSGFYTKRTVMQGSPTVPVSLNSEMSLRPRRDITSGSVTSTHSSPALTKDLPGFVFAS